MTYEQVAAIQVCPAAIYSGSADAILFVSPTRQPPSVVVISAVFYKWRAAKNGLPIGIMRVSIRV